MLLRRDHDGVIAIPQPSHAWLAGQIANVWGQSDFAPPSPRDDVCLAIEQHDMAWLDEDRRPHRAHDGWPREFWKVPAVEHTALWSAGVERVCLMSPYAALLVSLHGIRIYDLTFDASTASPDNRAAVERFRIEQRSVREALLLALKTDRAMAEHLTPEAINHNSRLLLALDTISLNLCWGLSTVIDIGDVPTKVGNPGRSMRLQPHPTRPDVVVISPWPFHVSQLTVKTVGKRLFRTAPDDETLDRQWKEAPLVTIRIVLEAG